MKSEPLQKVRLDLDSSEASSGNGLIIWAGAKYEA